MYTFKKTNEINIEGLFHQLHFNVQNIKHENNDNQIFVLTINYAIRIRIIKLGELLLIQLFYKTNLMIFS